MRLHDVQSLDNMELFQSNSQTHESKPNLHRSAVALSVHQESVTLTVTKLYADLALTGRIQCRSTDTPSTLL
jgi:hypothetical protein